MSSSSSSKHSSKKRKLSQARDRSNHEERDYQIQEFWDKGIVLAERSCVRARAGIVCVYPDMVTSDHRTDFPPADDAAESVWIGQDWVPRNGNENENDQSYAIQFPVESIAISNVVWDGLSKVRQERCVPTDSAFTYRRCPRDCVDEEAVGGTVLENYFLANAVRWCKDGESANCRLMLNPKNRQECVLISTRKYQKGEEWKLDRNYAHRMLGIGEYEQEPSDDSSVESMGDRGSSARASDPSEREIETSVPSREDLLRLEYSPENICRYLAAIDSKLYMVSKMLGQLKSQVHAWEGTKEDDRDAPPYSPIEHGDASPLVSPRGHASP
jgi:hypothetical protein